MSTPPASPKPKPKKNTPSGGATISFTELLQEVIVSVEAVTGYPGVTKQEHLHAVPRLGIVSNAKNQGLAATITNRPKVKAVNLKCTAQDVGVSDTVNDLTNLLWGKLPATSKH